MIGEGLDLVTPTPTASPRAGVAGSARARAAADLQRGRAGSLGTSSSAWARVGWTAFVALCVVSLGLCFIPVVPQDEGELLVYPARVAAGAMPYRDIWMMYPPLPYLVLAIAIKLGAAPLLAERALGLGARVFLVLAINRLLTGTWRRFSWVGVPFGFALAVFQLPLDVRAYPWALAIAPFWAGLYLTAHRRRFGTLFFLLSSMIRVEFALSAVVALVALVLLDAPDRRRHLRDLVTFAMMLSVSVALLTAMTGIDSLSQIVVDPLVRISPGRSLPLFSWGRSWLLPLAAFVVGAPAWCALSGFRRRLPDVASSNLAMVLLSQHCLQRLDPEYVWWTAALVLPWCLMSALSLLNSRGLQGQGGGERVWARRAISTVGVASSAWCFVAAALFVAALAPFSPVARLSALRHPTLLVRANNATVIAESMTEARDDRAVVAYINSRSRVRDTVYIAPVRLRYAMWNMTSLYALLNPHPASRYLEMNPGIETRLDVQREIARSLARCRWIVLWHGGFWYEPNASQRPGSRFLMSYVSHHYRPVLDNDTYTVLQAVRAAHGE